LSTISNPQARKLFQEWYDRLPPEIKLGTFPEFFSEIQAGPFDLVYCRYTLWITAAKDKEKLRSIGQDIARIIKPNTGRLVIVEPTKKGDSVFDFVSLFEGVGLTLEKIEGDTSQLGRLEPNDPEFDLKESKGYIFAKSK